MARPFCPGCGKRKRLRWLTFCSKDCAATNAFAIHSADPRGLFYCADCGEHNCQREHD